MESDIELHGNQGEENKEYVDMTGIFIEKFQILNASTRRKRAFNKAKNEDKERRG